MKFERPFAVLWEDNKSERHKVREITAYGHTYEFIIDGRCNVVLREKKACSV